MTAIEIITAAIECERQNDTRGIEQLWNLATTGQRAAIGRQVKKIMGAEYEADRDPFNRFLAFVEVCTHGYRVSFPELPVAVGHACVVCGRSLEWDRPSGVCSVECSNRGQGSIVEPTPTPSPWDRPFRLVAAVREDQRDWFFSARQQRVAAVLGQSDYEPAAKVESPAPIAHRVVGIAGFSYRVEPTEIDPSIGSHAFALVDLDRKREYVLHRGTHGENHCSCPDFVFRREGTGRGCKHVARLVELQLIPATTPRILPPFAARRERFQPEPDDYREAAVLMGWR